MPESPAQMYLGQRNDAQAEVIRLGAAVDALREIAKVSIPEINPDGDDQAADTMRLWAVATLEHLGVTVPDQRVSDYERPTDCTLTPRGGQ